MRNSFNLYAPVYESDDVPFSAYCFHLQRCDDIVQQIVANASNPSFSISVSDDFSEADLAYIRKELGRYGINANLSLN